MRVTHSISLEVEQDCQSILTQTRSERIIQTSSRLLSSLYLSHPNDHSRERVVQERDSDASPFVTQGVICQLPFVPLRYEIRLSAARQCPQGNALKAGSVPCIKLQDRRRAICFSFFHRSTLSYHSFSQLLQPNQPLRSLCRQKQMARPMAQPMRLAASVRAQSICPCWAEIPPLATRVVSFGQDGHSKIGHCISRHTLLALGALSSEYVLCCRPETRG